MNWTSLCKHDPEYVMNIDDVDYYGADQKGVANFNGDLVINFTKFSNIPSALNIPALAEHIKLGFKEEIMVSWPDFGVPRVNPSFWEALHKYIQSKGWDAVCFHCEAGHGRTGTALAGMLVATQGYSPEEAIGHVREYYCEDAVETHDQIGYLFELDKYYNGRELTEDTDIGSLPEPSMMSRMRQKQAHESKLKDVALGETEDHYEGFSDVSPNSSVE